eukprot:6252840-Pyramimonas_sp.AAC.1
MRRGGKRQEQGDNEGAEEEEEHGTSRGGGGPNLHTFGQDDACSQLPRPNGRGDENEIAQESLKAMSAK